MRSNDRQRIENILDENRVLTLATLRPDGWPQATTVGYAHSGLDIFFLCGRDSQKTRNLGRDDRVSLTVDHDTPDIMKIRGLSMAGHARRVTDPGEAQRIIALLSERYPEQEGLPLSMPTPGDVHIYRITPIVISILDYSKGFGHTDLVTC